MKSFNFHRYQMSQRVQDAVIVLAPPTLTLVVVLWFFRNDWVPMRLTHVVASFLSLY
jgi:hypothetical protein